MTDVAQMMLLRRLTVADIERDGSASSVMVRSGLLLDVLDLALAVAESDAPDHSSETPVE